MPTCPLEPAEQVAEEKAGDLGAEYRAGAMRMTVAQQKAGDLGAQQRAGAEWMVLPGGRLATWVLGTDCAPGTQGSDENLMTVWRGGVVLHSGLTDCRSRTSEGGVRALVLCLCHQGKPPPGHAPTDDGTG